MPPKASEYLSRLPSERQAMMRSLRDHIRRNLPTGYVERFEQGVFTYEVPLKTYPETYNGKPLVLAALASQQSYVTLYLMAVYGDKALEKWFRQAYAASGKRLQMGKSCVHFRKLEDIAVDVIGMTIGKVPVRTYIKLYERARTSTRSGK